eukprot:CAMPEP_0185900972 /NCGR_PEP_ID=MMETSP0196C-20130402/382_1 /TAXON_ID=2932 /ORGANISM="Alexandrium fundyense, Strain CCMP1719" /LENGTH=49 /DNA_ID=CAMNT_0028619537 /DNA_START=111 /DNA_END=260 /DNA_ORIENTATION=+
MAEENTNIFIAGLPAGLDDDKLKSIFEYCEENKDFVWLAGADGPEGFLG